MQSFEFRQDWCMLCCQNDLILYIVNSEDCGWIFMKFVEQFDDIELKQDYFQDDGATCRTDGAAMAFVTSSFGNRITSSNL